MTADRSFRVTGPRGLDHSLLPMTLWRKAKQFESRLARLERAQGQSLDSILRGTRE